MSSNTNLFYLLYSTSNDVASSGYTCSSAVDESDTSFDLTSSTSSSGTSVAGEITDSNGDTLASIDLSDIHVSGVTQYNTETRILLPYSCCLLQGQEYGLACASYSYLIPKQLLEVSGYETYCKADFDIVYNNFDPLIFHVSTEVDGETSFIDLVNDELNNYNIEVQVSLLSIDCNGDGTYRDHLVFLSLKEGYFYYITNLKLTPAFQSTDYPDSPFSKSLSNLRTIIIELIEQFHPIKTADIPECSDDCECDDDCSCKKGGYDEDTYEVDCELYKWILNNYLELVDNLDDFKKAIELLKKIDDDTEESEVEAILEEVNLLIADTPYDSDLINEYNVENMEIIANIIESIKALIEESNDYFQDMYWLIECKKLRVPLMKYPNGAYKGIVLIPDWPTVNSEDYEHCSLWVNHVKSLVKLYRPTKEGQFLPKIYGVLSNATLTYEQLNYKRTNPNFGSIQSNESLCRCKQDGWNDTLSSSNCNCCINQTKPENLIYEDTMYMGQNCYASKKNVIGLFRYMLYVNENKLWTKVGQAYMVIGNDDDPQSKEKNLPTSLIIYNPNPYTIRLKYMIFS